MAEARSEGMDQLMTALRENAGLNCRRRMVEATVLPDKGNFTRGVLPSTLALEVIASNGETTRVLEAQLAVTAFYSGVWKAYTNSLVETGWDFWSRMKAAYPEDPLGKGYRATRTPGRRGDDAHGSPAALISQNRP
jgi:hypothetical protein